jgi:hypothetical protein
VANAQAGGAQEPLDRCDRDYAEEAILGPIYKATRKGDVAHLAPAEDSVDARRQPADPRLVIFPSFREGAPLTTRRLPAEDAFARLAFNSFNYGVLGETSFNAVADVIDSCPAFALEYSRLDEAVEVVAGNACRIDRDCEGSRMIRLGPADPCLHSACLALLGTRARRTA